MLTIEITQSYETRFTSINKFFHGFPGGIDIVFDEHHFTIRISPLWRVFLFKRHKLLDERKESHVEFGYIDTKVFAHLRLLRAYLHRDGKVYKKLIYVVQTKVL